MRWLPTLALSTIVISAHAQSFDGAASDIANAKSEAQKKGETIEVKPDTKDVAVKTDVVVPPGVKWANESRLGIVVANGNSKNQSYALTHKTEAQWASDLLRFNAGGLKSVAGDVKTAENYLLGLRYERSLTAMFSVFVGQDFQGDVFRGFRQQYNTDVGGKYFIIKDTAPTPATKDLNLFSEAGYRFTHTNWEVVNDTNRSKLNYLRLYVEGEKYWTPTFSSKLWVEYLPNLNVSKDWQLNTELSFSASINSIFSMQSAFLLKQDNVPSGHGIKTDTLFTTGLVAKF